jgi:predicted PurR-regulated permease PerM/methylmalonyl-CoA mutase cobalamin-binding subunit
MTLAAIIIVVAALYLAQEVLIPIVLAFLFCFMLAPLVRRVERIGLGRIVSVLLVVLFAFTIVGGIGWTMTRQVVAVTAKLPEYKHNIRHKIESLRGQTTSPVIKLTEAIQEIQQITTQPATQTAPAPGAKASADEFIIHESPPSLPAPLREPLSSTDPVPVRIVEHSTSNLWKTITSTLGIVARQLATIGIIIILVVFFLIQREDLRDRIISLMGRSRIHVTTVAFDDAAQRISRYLLMQFIVNCMYGIPVGIGLHLMGLPNALLWGMLGIVLRYMPYIGPTLTALMPITLSLAVFDDWWHPLMVIAFFVVIEIISNNAVEPWLYGHSTGMSSTAVIIAAVFWTWLWGPVGLLISTPITACFVVLGRHIPQLEFLSTLLGDQPVLDPPTRFYQRLLAMDQEEATDLLEEFLKEAGTNPLQAYDQLLIPALRLAENDHHRGTIDEERLRFVYQSMRTLIDELGEWLPRKAEEVEESAASDRAPANLPRDFQVLSLPARDEADELAAAMLSQVLQSKGFKATHLSAEHLSGEMMTELAASSAKVVCISALPPNAIIHARYLYKKLRREAPEVIILVGLWSARVEPQKIAERIGLDSAAKVVTTFTQALQEIHLLAQNVSPPPEGKTRARQTRAPV